MDILIQRSWLTNLGNGFIDKGAKALVESVFPDANVFETSGYAQRAAYRTTLGSSPQQTSFISHLSARNITGNLAKAGYNTYDYLKDVIDGTV